MSRTHPDRDFIAQLEGLNLTTAEILYRLPDYPSILQTYVWQDYDMFPHFPNLKRFLKFWTTNLEGPLYRVKLAHVRLCKPVELKVADGVFCIN
ncbi:MAG: hypothetical protein WAX89_06740 [Alphaproteobacteria bacterium]